MFTIKFYSHDGCRQIIEQADSFTILRSPPTDAESAEITLHRKGGDSLRRDVCQEVPRPDGWPPIFGRAIIENAAGKTTEIISAMGPYSTAARAA